MFLDKSTEPRDVEEHGSRFWVTDGTESMIRPFGPDTVGVVDENEGGVVAYVHADNAQRLIDALRAYTEEV